jgi:hypothetical protein
MNECLEKNMVYNEIGYGENRFLKNESINKIHAHHVWSYR